MHPPYLETARRPRRAQALHVVVPAAAAVAAADQVMPHLDHGFYSETLQREGFPKGQVFPISPICKCVIYRGWSMCAHSYSP